MRNDELTTLAKGFRPTLLGFGLFWAWVFLFFDPPTFSHWAFLGVRATLWAHLLSLAATIPVYLFMTFAHRAARRILNSRPACVAFLFLMVLGTFVYAFPGFTDFPALQLTGAVITGLFSPFLLVLWGEEYGGLEVRPAIVYTALSFLVAELLYLAMSALPVLGTALGASAIPLLSFAAILMRRGGGRNATAVTAVTAAAAVTAVTAAAQPQGQPQPQAQPQMQAQTQTQGQTSRGFELQTLRRLLPPRILFGFLIVMFIYGGSLSFHNAWDSQETATALCGALPLIVVVGIVLGAGLLTSKQGLNLGVAYRLSLLFMAAIFIPLALLGNSFVLLSVFFASLGINAIEILTWILLAYMASITTIPRFTVFAACMAVFHVGMTTGEIAGILLIDNVLAFSLLAICALVALAGFAFTDRDTTIRFDPPSLNELGEIVARSGLMHDAVEQIALDFSLSEREREVFMLWSTGYGAKAIEKKLFISSSTVKTHIQHIYEKCAVHSRTEIIALLEEYASKG
jgi:DNA-binding CsgD family transcriptional regulator